MVQMQKLDKLRSLLIYLSEHNRYYQEIQKKLQYDVYHDDIREIYKSLPIVTKLDIIENQDTYFTDNIRGEEIFEEVTSGSSGKVLKCYKTSTERTMLALNIWKQRRLFDPLVNTTNYCNLFNNEMEEMIGRVYDVEEETIIKNFYKLIALNPRWIAGPISLLSKLAILIREGTIYYKNDGTLKFIEFHGENVDENSRNLIEQVFECNTINNYGTRETWCIALDCPDKKLHVQDYMIPDVAPDQENDKLLVTSLINKYMPVIKYANGDCGKPLHDACSCGNSNEVIWLKGGRETDFITGTNVLGSYFFDSILWETFDKFGPIVHEFQVYQRSSSDFEFVITKGTQYTEEAAKFIRQRILSELGESYSVRFTFLSHITPLSNGKLKKFYPYIA